MKSMGWCLLQINMLPFYRLQKWGWGQMFAWMDGDGDDLETSRGDSVGDQRCGDGYKYMSTCSSLVTALGQIN